MNKQISKTSIYVYLQKKDETELSSFIGSGDDEKRHIETTDDLNNVLAKIVGDYMHKLYFRSNNDEITYQSLWGLRDNNTKPNKVDVESCDQLIDKEKARDYIMRDLFLWAMLMNRTDMAKVFLSYMKYRICAALIATKILKEYYNVATHGELKDSYMKNADYFQDYAIACISQCEKNDPVQSCEIILQRMELYGNVTCLQV